MGLNTTDGLSVPPGPGAFRRECIRRLSGGTWGRNIKSWHELCSLLDRARLLQQYSRDEGYQRRQEPLHPPRLNGLKISQVLN
jgi:hypothetical protein